VTTKPVQNRGRLAAPATPGASEAKIVAAGPALEYSNCLKSFHGALASGLPVGVKANFANFASVIFDFGQG
jgi:hypothetical protein